MKTPAVLVALLLLSASPLHAQWQLDGALLTTAVSDQLYPAMVSDNAGGAVIAWQDFRNGATYNVYAQRINASGVPQWTANGVLVCNAANGQDEVVIVGDGAGGVIVTWRDSRGAGSDIYAQRLNGSGVAQWTANGVSVCSATGNQLTPVSVADGAGGAIVSWRDNRVASSDIYAQRINGAGVVQWTVDGIAVCSAAGSQLAPAITGDGASGAIVTWEDNRSGNADIYVQRINSAGAVQWAANGAALCTVANSQRTPFIVSDSAGGAVVTWWDMRTAPTNGDIYAQRINAAGVVQWTANGTAICTAADNQLFPAIAADGTGGAIIVWQDFRTSTNYDLYVQRVDGAGVTRFTPNGILVSAAAGDQTYPLLTSDGVGGALVSWLDQRSGNIDIYAQHLTGAGTMLWTSDGVPVCQAPNPQDVDVIAPDGTGGVLLCWQEARSGSDHLYAQRMEGSYGYWGRPEPALVTVKDVPEDQGGHVAINWTASPRDIPSPATIDHYSVWRAVDTAPGGGYYWELAGTQPATRFATYSFSAQTRADSVLNNHANEYFMVTAHPQADNQIAFASNVLTGHSVDNLSPDTPPFLVAQRDGADVVLKWNRSRAADLRNYVVYRSGDRGVATVPDDLLGSSVDTTFVDANAPERALRYVVVAADVHGNRSATSNSAAVAPAGGTHAAPSLTHLVVLQNRPNPFQGSTEMEIGLPSASRVEILVFDVAGRRVRAQALSRVNAGWQKIAFDGRNDAGAPLPSGVYFYRVTAGASTFTRKLVIAR